MEKWLEAPVGVFGAGVSGKAASDFILSLGGKTVVYDEVNSDFHGRFTLREARRHKLIVVSPGFAANHKWLEAARRAGCEVMGELDLASLFWKGHVVAVTGTNGKSTLVEFVTHSLRYAGLEAHAVGNIGFPFTEHLKEEHHEEAWAVVEVSSFQAELMTYFRANTVVWSNFTEDHLDRYADMHEYFRAKARLLKVADASTVLVGKQVERAYRRYRNQLPRETYVVDYPYLRVPKHSVFNLKPQRENFQLAYMLFKSWGYDPEMLHDSVRSFKQSPHRLAPVVQVNGIEFWNDSKATNFSSAEAALKNFHQPIFWIGGGRRKGGQVDAFVHRIANRIKKAFVMGDTAEELKEQFEAMNVACDLFHTMEEAIISAYNHASPGSVVLFSPGFASQKPFRNYSERGECFERVASELKLNLQLTR
ncbi:MAG: UDP-N-acetylmuramoyl-L-alanine--D-glutamate ligase [Verrucomicrobiae bacterium]|nr:UDP-N-acetylmuramoyl-L-alanine--D-glutamate ligase [Verrucomicrobiae bacterium]